MAFEVASVLSLIKEIIELNRYQVRLFLYNYSLLHSGKHVPHSVLSSPLWPSLLRLVSHIERRRTLSESSQLSLGHTSRISVEQKNHEKVLRTTYDISYLSVRKLKRKKVVHNQ